MVRNTALRITFAYLAAFALATAALGGIVYRIARHALEQQLDDRIAAEMSSLLSEYRGEGDAGLHEVIRNREVARATNDLGYGLFDAHGRRVAGSLQVGRPGAGWQILSFQDPREGPDEARALATPIGGGQMLVVAADLDSLDQADDLILLTLAGTLFGMVVIGTVGALTLGAFLRARLAVIATSAEAIIDGDMSQRIPVGRNQDEFDRVSIILNRMLDRIATLLANLQQVSSDIAHDLRQPLTRLRTNLETSLHPDRPQPEIERAIAQTDEVLALFGAILRLSEIEAGNLRRAFRPIDLAQLAREIGETYAPAIEDGGRMIRCDIAPTASIDGDRELLAQTIINLLDNAQAHTSIGTVIRLSVRQADDRVSLTVADNGAGVPIADQQRILQRFTRLEASRHVPGHGLGLSLVAAIAQMHKAELILADCAPGLSVSLVFPSAR